MPRSAARPHAPPAILAGAATASRATSPAASTRRSSTGSSRCSTGPPGRGARTSVGVARRSSAGTGSFRVRHELLAAALAADLLPASAASDARRPCRGSAAAGRRRSAATLTWRIEPLRELQGELAAAAAAEALGAAADAAGAPGAGDRADGGAGRPGIARPPPTRSTCSSVPPTLRRPPGRPGVARRSSSLPWRAIRTRGTGRPARSSPSASARSVSPGATTTAPWPPSSGPWSCCQPTPALERARLLAILAQVRMLEGRFTVADELAAEAISVAEAVGPSARAWLGHATLHARRRRRLAGQDIAGHPAARGGARDRRRRGTPRRRLPRPGQPGDDAGPRGPPRRGRRRLPARHRGGRGGRAGSRPRQPPARQRGRRARDAGPLGRGPGDGGAGARLGALGDPVRQRGARPGDHRDGDRRGRGGGAAPRPAVPGAGDDPRCPVRRAGVPGRCLAGPVARGPADARAAIEIAWSRVRDSEDWVIGARTAAATLAVADALARAGRERRDIASLGFARTWGDDVLRRATRMVEASGAPAEAHARLEAEADLATARAYAARLHGRDDPEAWALAAGRWRAVARPYETARALRCEVEAQARAERPVGHARRGPRSGPDAAPRERRDRDGPRGRPPAARARRPRRPRPHRARPGVPRGARGGGCRAVCARGRAGRR